MWLDAIAGVTRRAVSSAKAVRRRILIFDFMFVFFLVGWLFEFPLCEFNSREWKKYFAHRLLLRRRFQSQAVPSKPGVARVPTAAAFVSTPPPGRPRFALRRRCPSCAQ